MIEAVLRDLNFWGLRPGLLESIEIENALGRYSPASDYSVQPEPKSAGRTVSVRNLLQTAI